MNLHFSLLISQRTFNTYRQLTIYRVCLILCQLLIHFNRTCIDTSKIVRFAAEIERKNYALRLPNKNLLFIETRELNTVQATTVNSQNEKKTPIIPIHTPMFHVKRL